MSLKILITGSAGYLGTKVVDILAARFGYEIYGIDISQPHNPAAYKHFVKGSVVDPLIMKRLFESAEPDIAVHLAFVVRSTHDRKKEEFVDIIGTKNFLDCAAKHNVSKVVFLSSAAAYGAHDDNDVPLTETSPTRGVEGYGYSRLKAKTDLMMQEFEALHKNVDCVTLRPCLFVGQNTDNNFFDVLKYPVVPMIRDGNGLRDPEFQFIHEDDMAECLAAAIEKKVSGVFNVAAEGSAKFSELVFRYGKKSVGVPSSIIYPATKLLWKLHLVTSPPAQLDFIRYPWLMDPSKMHRDLYLPRKTTLEAFDEYVRFHR